MPNWCENQLNIYFKNNEKLMSYSEKLKKAFNENKFNKMIIPYKDMGVEDYDYNLCIEHWGTKWDTDLSYFNREITKDRIDITVIYSTAWAPNIPVLEKLYEILSKIDEDVIVECIYEEPGMNFCGKFVNGNDETYDINIAHSILSESLIPLNLENSESGIKLCSDSDVFFIEKSREDYGEYSPVHDEHIQFEIIKCFSNYYSWGDGEVTIIKYNDDYYIY